MPQQSAYLVIGHPIGHSMSPFIHKRLFALQGRAASYTAQDMAPDRLADTLPALLREVSGCNVTIPHKQAVIPLLDRLADRAALYRSVNTIAVTPAGTVGHNTDAEGFRRALEEGGVPLAGRVALLGCGGAGRTFACEAALAGCSIVNAVRPGGEEKALALRDFVRGLVPTVSYAITDLSSLSGDFDLLLNATPVGMYPHEDASPVGDAVLSRTAAVFDAVYKPGQTLLLRRAAAHGARTVGGMPMLVWQAAAAHTIWYGAVFDPADIARLIDKAQQEMETVFGRKGD